jgi:hypothetical protein
LTRTLEVARALDVQTRTSSVPHLYYVPCLVWDERKDMSYTSTVAVMLVHEADKTSMHYAHRA